MLLVTFLIEAELSIFIIKVKREMEGIDFFVDSKGRKTKVLIDLDKYRYKLKDAFNFVDLCLKKEEPPESWDAVKAKLVSIGKIKEGE